MTHKDFVAISGAIASRWKMAQSIQNRLARESHYMEVATSIADVMAADNPRFDRDRFLIACKVTR